MTTFETLLYVFLLYWIVVMYLDRKGTLKKYNISAYGPVLMIRTTKGQEFLDKLANPKKFWRGFADIGLPLMILGMFVMFLLILIVDYSMISSFQTHTVPPPNKFNEPRNIFLIPGINEFIPLVWGGIALIVTLIVHEFSHAILCKVEGIRVKSMGILLALVPIGGFAEPDEEQLLGKKTGEKTDKPIATTKQRVRILTAGVMANFITAFVAFIFFFSLLSSISPVGELMVTNVISGYPSEEAGIKPEMVITHVNDKEISSAHDFLFYLKSLEAGSNVKFDVVEQGIKKEISLTTIASNETRIGVRVFGVVPESPAEAAGVKEDMVLIKIDDTEIEKITDFTKFMKATKEGQVVDVYFLSNNSLNASVVVFEDIKLSAYPDNSNNGFLGVSYAPEGGISYSTGIGVGQFPAKTYLDTLKSIPSQMSGLSGWLYLFSLPIIGLSGEGFPGFSGTIVNFYEPVGFASQFGIGIFWLLNILLWIGWMNFYVGLFNCLPAVPLDGGHVFRDIVTTSLSKITKNYEKAEAFSNTVVVTFAIFIFLSFIFVMIAPYISYMF